MDKKHRKYGLIGRELAHSFSENYFNSKFQDEEIDAGYENISLDKIDEVAAVLGAGNYHGFNVTIPYKEQIIPYLDRLDETAKAIGAVNTVLIKDGKAIGYNTDAFGFKQMIKPFFESHHERAMILGTGGASKAIAYVLEELGVNLIYISRSLKDNNCFEYADINENMVKFNGIIVNTTPVGMYPNNSDVVDFPYEFLTDQHLVIDLIYNPLETVFLKNAKQYGAVVHNGLTMLHQQAEKAWRIWNT